MTRVREFLIHPFFIGLILSIGISHYLVNDNPNKYIILAICLCIALPKIVLEFFLLGRYIISTEKFKFFKTACYFIALGMLIRPVLLKYETSYEFEQFIKLITLYIPFSIGYFLRERKRDNLNR